MIIQKYTIGQSVFIEDDLNIVNNCIGTVIKTFKNTKCIGKGAHIGGNKGKIFMPEYLNFWKKNLIN